MGPAHRAVPDNILIFRAFKNYFLQYYNNICICGSVAVFIFRSFISPLPLHVRNHSGARNKSRFALLVVSCWCGCLLVSVRDVVIRGLSHITGLGIGENNHSNQIQITFNLLFLFSSIPHLLCSFCFFSKVFSVRSKNSSYVTKSPTFPLQYI